MLQGLGMGRMHKVIKMTFWACIFQSTAEIMLFSLVSPNTEGSPSDQHEEQLRAVELCPDCVLASEDQDYISALCSVPSCENQSTGKWGITHVWMEQEHLTCVYANMGTTGHDLRFEDWKSPKSQSKNMLCGS